MDVKKSIRKRGILKFLLISNIYFAKVTFLSAFFLGSFALGSLFPLGSFGCFFFFIFLFIRRKQPAGSSVSVEDQIPCSEIESFSNNFLKSLCYKLAFLLVLVPEDYLVWLPS